MGTTARSDGRNSLEEDTGSSRGVVYTETVVFSPPEQYAADAPYQLAILDLEDGRRRTVRILGKDSSERVHIGDTVVLAETRDGVAYYRKGADKPAEDINAELARPLV